MSLSKINNLIGGDKQLLSNGDNLSLLSIASVLRKGVLSDDDYGYNNCDDNSNLEMENNSEFGELITISIDNNNNNNFSIELLKKKSEELSTLGNKCANNGQYLEAIRYYSKAIALFDEDYRLFCNRSYCYERIMNYEDSLADALRSVILMPTKAKPYFRQGKALIGLKRYKDAEKAFNKIIQMDPKCEETDKELLKTRYLALRDFGLTIEDATLVAINHRSIDEAIEASLNRKFTNICNKNKHNLNADHYQSHRLLFAAKTLTRFVHNRRSQSRPPTKVADNNNSFNTTTTSNILKTSFLHKRSHSVDNLLRFKRSENFMVKKSNEYRLPKNLFGYKGLWIGNVSPNCKVSHLQSIFSKYGVIDYANVVGASFCAFVNYHSSNAPRVAIANLYGQVISGISNGDRPLVFRFIPGNEQKDLHYMRPYQPKGTNECYFWRTTGCRDFNCHLLHYPICKGIDFQPWMAKRNKKF